MKIERERNISNLLTKLGIPTNLAGYHYLKLSIDILIDKFNEGNWDTSITREIYPVVAEKCRASSSSVERAMRHAIIHTFDRAPTNALKEVFQNTINPNSGKMSNHEFIARVAEYYRLNMKE